MYRYWSAAPKRRERWFTWSAAMLCLVFFALSKIPNILLPGVFRLLGLCHLIAFFVLLFSCVLLSYVYCIEPREGGYAEDVPDFVILQRQGKRTLTVCRISVSDVVSVTHVAPENRKRLERERQGVRVYHYVDRIRPDNLYLLTVRDGESEYDLRIMADERLLSYF